VRCDDIVTGIGQSSREQLCLRAFAASLNPLERNEKAVFQVCIHAQGHPRD
jgi:hypothetical protein